jgi:hypothetical protein
MNGQKFWPVFGTLVFLSISLAVINLNEDWKEDIREFLLSDKRVILAKASGDLGGQGKDFTILKVQTRDSLAVEVYQKIEGSPRLEFRGRMILPEKRDGHFTFHDNAVNLLMMDVNGDGSSEIVTAAYDENLVPRVHILGFDQEKSEFVTFGPDTLQF